MNILIFSDYEPDDFLTLMVLMFVHVKNLVTLVITENNHHTLQQKCMDAAHFFPTFHVMYGATSTKHYDFTRDSTSSERSFTKYYAKNAVKPDRIYGIAPIRDIVDAVVDNPLVFVDAEVLFYGGFNFAEVVNTDHRVADWTAFFSNSFKRVVVFELRFAIGSQFSFTQNNSQFLRTLIQHPTKSPQMQRLLTLIQAWNKHISSKTRSDLVSILPTSPLSTREWDNVERKIKINRNVDTDPYQLLAADVLLIMSEMIVDDLVPVSFVLGLDGRFEYKDVGMDSKVFLFRPSNNIMMPNYLDSILMKVVFPDQNNR